MALARLKIATAALVAVGAGAGLYAAMDAYVTFRHRPFAEPLAEVAAAAALKKDLAFTMHDPPKPVPHVRFQDAAGRDLSLTAFRDRVVLLNIWATWCAPCRREMPTLDRLQAKLGGPDFEVVALSIDRAGIDAVRSFWREIGVEHLAMYVDATGEAATELGAVGLPTTLLIGRDGREIGRLVGPAEWDTPEMVEIIRKQLATQAGSRAPPTSGHAPADGAQDSDAPRVRRPATSEATSGGTEP